MRKILVVLVSVGAVWNAADFAQAFHHRVRVSCISHYPGLYSFGYCGGPPCPPAPYTFPCVYRYPKFCGPHKSCWTGRLICATKWRYRRCGLLGGGSCGHLCGGCAPCGYGYGCGGYGCGEGCGACGSGACGSGTCGSGCSINPSGETPYSLEGEGEILYDGPASDAPPVPTPDPSVRRWSSPFRLTAQTERDGTAAFNRGTRLYRDGNLTQALAAFEEAAAAEPRNALYHYYRALTLYNLHGAEAARDWLAEAVELEQQQPIAGWGRRMERIQGRARLWIEQARSDAGLGR